MPYKTVVVNANWLPHTKRSNPHDTVNMQELAKSIAATTNKLENDGWIVISVTPILGGSWINWTSGGAGLSLTDGVIILARKDISPVSQ